MCLHPAANVLKMIMSDLCIPGSGKGSLIFGINIPLL